MCSPTFVAPTFASIGVARGRVTTSTRDAAFRSASVHPCFITQVLRLSRAATIVGCESAGSARTSPNSSENSKARLATCRREQTSRKKARSSASLTVRRSPDRSSSCHVANREAFRPAIDAQSHVLARVVRVPHYKAQHIRRTTSMSTPSG